MLHVRWTDSEFMGIFDRGMLRGPSDDPRPVGWVRFDYEDFDDGDHQSALESVYGRADK